MKKTGIETSEAICCICGKSGSYYPRYDDGSVACRTCRPVDVEMVEQESGGYTDERDPEQVKRDRDEHYRLLAEGTDLIGADPDAGSEDECCG